MKKYLEITILGLCILFVSCDKHIVPISLHEENSHYFIFHGKPTVLITSGEHYGAVLNLDFDYTAYLDELQSRGLNCTRLFTGTYVEFPGGWSFPAEQPLSPAPGRFICPWARSSKPGYINGGNKFDLTKWDNEYFKRLKDFFTQAARRGIVVELTLFCPYYDTRTEDHDLLWKYSPFYWENNINGVGNISRTKALTMDNGNLLDIQGVYIRKIVNELKDYDNLIYEICNEPYIQDLASYDWMVHISQIIENVESTYGYRHLLTQNIANGSTKIFNPIPNVSVFNFHYSEPTAISLNYELNKVIGNNETFGESNIIERVHGWDFVIGGGGLYNNLDFSFSTSNAAGGTPDSEGAILRSQFSTLKKFIEGFDFIRMKPDSLVIKGVVMQGISAYALAETGVAYAVYLRKSDLQDIKPRSCELGINLPTGNYKVVWVNPVTGEVNSEITFAHSGGERKLNSPLFDIDIALDIRRIDNI